MALSIQYDSVGVELPVIYRLEFDPNVLEYYDQPPTVLIHYKDAEGKMQGHRIFPDFFAIEEDRAYFIDCKPEDQLLKLTLKHPGRFIYNELGEWRSPAAEAAAAELGFGYKLISSAQLGSTYQSNLELLHEHLRIGLAPVPPKIRKAVDARVRESMAPTTASVLKDVPDARIHHIFDLILDGAVVTDLESEKLSGPNDLRLFPTKRALQVFQKVLATEASTGLIHDLNLRLVEGDTFRFQNQIYTVYDRTQNSLTVGNNDGPVHQWRLADVKTMIVGGLIKPAPRNVKIDPSQLEGASQTEWADALKRLEEIRPFLDAASNPRAKRRPTDRSTRRWLRAYRVAEKEGWGLRGLLSRKCQQGNRAPRFAQPILDIMCRVVDQVYGTPDCATAIRAYGHVVNDCKGQNFTPPSMSSFYDFLRAQNKRDLTKKRIGPRAAYQLDWALSGSDRTKHGEWPFHICHMDNTLLDIELVSSITGELLGRPWLSILIDGYSRRVLAFNLWFDAPSYRTSLAMLDRCVRRYERMPNTFVVDHGSDYKCIYFQTVTKGFSCEVRNRPAAKPRFGAICERLFGTINTQFVHNLLGNTRIMKNVRMVTKEFNPKTRAAWTLEALTVALREYFYELYDTTEHPALQMSPRQAFELGQERVGHTNVRSIPYNDAFRILCLPSTRKMTVKVSPRSGIRVNGLDYTAPALRDRTLENKSVEVRFDPDDISICYACVHRRWIECTARNHGLLRHWSQKLLDVASKVERHKGNTRRQALPEATAHLAKRISEIQKTPEFHLQHERDAARHRSKALLDGNVPLHELFPQSGEDSGNKIVEFAPEKRKRRRASTAPTTPDLEAAANASFGHM